MNKYLWDILNQIYKKNSLLDLLFFKYLVTNLFHRNESINFEFLIRSRNKTIPNGATKSILERILERVS